MRFSVIAIMAAGAFAAPVFEHGAFVKLSRGLAPFPARDFPAGPAPTVTVSGTGAPTRVWPRGPAPTGIFPRVPNPTAPVSLSVPMVTPS
ncbi:hypothetical protein NX059_011987 [Plenodomus lindquistii]|nr:hypothetical protein NX059_011987 [Plenodomus lindquistii]